MYPHLFHCAFWGSWLIIRKTPYVLNLLFEYFFHFLALAQWFSTGVICPVPQRIFWRYFGVSQLEVMLLTTSRWKPGTLLKILPCTGQCLLLLKELSASNINSAKAKKPWPWHIPEGTSFLAAFSSGVCFLVTEFGGRVGFPSFSSLLTNNSPSLNLFFFLKISFELCISLCHSPPLLAAFPYWF